jgi:hypothetical protein
VVRDQVDEVDARNGAQGDREVRALVHDKTVVGSRGLELALSDDESHERLIAGSSEKMEFMGLL